MATENNTTSGTLLDTVSGTALAVSMNIDSLDIIKTVILAVIGAVVSFSMSLLLKWLTRRFRK
ncbi:MAG TPA: hypothetical protein VGF30_08925 [Bacteroidia bacterium]